MSKLKFSVFVVVVFAAWIAVLSSAGCSEEVKTCGEGETLKLSHTQPIWAGKTLVMVPVYACKADK